MSDPLSLVRSSILSAVSIQHIDGYYLFDKYGIKLLDTTQTSFRRTLRGDDEDDSNVDDDDDDNNDSDVDDDDYDDDDDDEFLISKITVLKASIKLYT